MWLSEANAAQHEPQARVHLKPYTAPPSTSPTPTLTPPIQTTTPPNSTHDRATASTNRPLHPEASRAENIHPKRLGSAKSCALNPTHKLPGQKPSTDPTVPQINALPNRLTASAPPEQTHPRASSPPDQPLSPINGRASRSPAGDDASWPPPAPQSVCGASLLEATAWQETTCRNPRHPPAP